MRPSASSYIPACLSRKARTREETAALCLPRNRTWLRACRTTSSQTKSRACFVRKLYRCMAASPNKQSKKRRASFSLGWLLRRWLRFSFFLALSFVDFCDWVLFRAATAPCSSFVSKIRGRRLSVSRIVVRRRPAEEGERSTMRIILTCSLLSTPKL